MSSGNKTEETVRDGVCITPENPYCPACQYGRVDFPTDFVWEEGGPVKWECLRGCDV